MDEINLEAAFGDMAQEMNPDSTPVEQQQEVELAMVETASPEEVAQEAIQAPEGFDPTMMQNQMQSQSEAIAEMAKSIAMMNEPKQPEVPMAEPTEEDMIRQRARKELGLDELDNKFKAQEESLRQQNEYIEQMKEQEAIRQREQEFSSMEKEFGNVDREAIQNHILEVGKTNPNLAEALNSPEGVRMLLKQGVGAVVKQPDAITPSASGTDVNTSDASSRVMNGNGTADDYGSLLESYVS